MNDKPCEKCGHCPVCGRGPVVTYPYPAYPYWSVIPPVQYRPPNTITCTITSVADPSRTVTRQVAGGNSGLARY